MMPKFGMTLEVPGEYNTVRWYGRGPQETYWDRKTGGEIAIHELPVEQMVFPYVRAGHRETGPTCDGSRLRTATASDSESRVRHR